jgi:hypothetical protein
MKELESGEMSWSPSVRDYEKESGERSQSMNGLSPFKQGFLGGLGALLVVGLLFIVVTAVAQDDEYDATKDIDKDGQVDALDVQSVAAAWNSTGSPRAPLVVFNTTATYTGSGPSAYGRRGMHEACRAEDPAAHFCSVHEIENALRTTGVAFRSHGAAWVDTFVLRSLSDTFNGQWVGGSDWAGGYTSSTDYPLNCGAWTTESSDAWGYAINTGAIAPSLGRCNMSVSVACCK